MSQKPTSRSADLRRLREEGYDIEIRSSHLLVRGIPYVNENKTVQSGTLVVKLNLAGDETGSPEDHTIWFDGEYPCSADGTAIEQIRSGSESKKLADGVAVRHRFSAKPKPSGAYADYYAQVSTYCSILSGPAKMLDPTVTAKNFAPVAPDVEGACAFNYEDSASAANETSMTSTKLKGRIAIIGLGGTGAYVLDLVAKTPVPEIHLFDKDRFFSKNAFRTPGAPSIEELRARPYKVDYLAGIYSKMHRGIVPHQAHIDRDNVEELRPMEFVFLCLDDGPAKKLIVEQLEEYGISFIDVGMGMYAGDDGLGGSVRVTTSTPSQRAHVHEHVSFADGNEHNEYGRNIQIADLNAFNAAMAVIKWKKLCGFYMDFEKEHHSTYSVEVHLLTKEVSSA